jgi:hypothetical protein
VKAWSRVGSSYFLFLFLFLLFLMQSRNKMCRVLCCVVVDIVEFGRDRGRLNSKEGRKVHTTRILHSACA